jgi:hypothetical protein
MASPHAGEQSRSYASSHWLLQSDTSKSRGIVLEIDLTLLSATQPFIGEYKGDPDKRREKKTGVYCFAISRPERASQNGTVVI